MIKENLFVMNYSKSLKQWFSDWSVHQNHLEGLLSQRPLSPSSRISNSVGLGWCPKICISNKLIDAAATSGSVTK